MNATRRNLLLALLALAAIAASATLAFRPRPVEVDVAQVDRGPLEVVLAADARTRVKELYKVTAPVGGLVRRIGVEPGDRVEAGKTLLAVIEPAPPALLDARARKAAKARVREAEAAVKAAEAALEEAKRRLAIAEKDYERARALVERGVASLTEVERASERLTVARAARHTAEAELERARAALEQARAELAPPARLASNPGPDCCLEIRAPADGIVLEVPEKSARPVVPGTFLLSVGDPVRLEAVADILSSRAIGIAPGMEVRITLWGGPGDLPGRVARIAPTAKRKVTALGIEEQRVDVTLDVLAGPKARLGLGHDFAVRAEIIRWRGENVLRLPVGALFRAGDGWAVFVIRDGVARRVWVEIGHRNALFAELRSGLTEGESVILYPPENVEDGTPVTPRAEAEKAG